MKPILSIRNLQVYYPLITGVVKAVDNVSLDIYEGEVLGLIGESGSGKSTLGLSILKLVPPPGRIVNGSIIFEGTDLVKLPETEMRKVRGRKISMIFQDPSAALNPLIKVGEHIVEMLISHTGADVKKAWKIAEETLESLGIPKARAYDYPHQLSGGMKQRVMIATAIVLKPKLIIADEPTTALDVIVQDQILDIFKYLKSKFKLSIMLITHDLSIVADLADKTAIMYAGKIVEYGTVDQIYYDPLHPYTRGLLASIPQLGKKKELYVIPGEPPDLRNPPSGCRFHPRCSKAMDICRKKEPPEVVLEDGRRVLCWLYAKR